MSDLCMPSLEYMEYADFEASLESNKSVLKMTQFYTHIVPFSTSNTSVSSALVTNIISFLARGKQAQCLQPFVQL